MDIIIVPGLGVRDVSEGAPGYCGKPLSELRFIRAHTNIYTYVLVEHYYTEICLCRICTHKPTLELLTDTNYALEILKYGCIRSPMCIADRVQFNKYLRPIANQSLVPLPELGIRDVSEGGLGYYGKTLDELRFIRARTLVYIHVLGFKPQYQDNYYMCACGQCIPERKLITDWNYISEMELYGCIRSTMCTTDRIRHNIRV